MWRNYRSNTAEKGFTLIEATISLTLLLVVLVVSMTFLFSMRTFSQRQEMFTSPRQTARRALDYLNYYVRGAGDLNTVQNNPNAIVVWYKKNTSGADVQATYDNVTNSSYGDVGTDMISLALPPLTPISAQYEPNGSNFDASTGDVYFTAGCGTSDDDTANMNLFKTLTGCCDAFGNSPVLTLVDSKGNWDYFMITGYQGSYCSSGYIHVTANHGNSLGVNPPGGPALEQPAYIKVGVFYNTFRVKNGELQQRAGVFDPSNPDAGFVTLLNNVEDMQIAYIFDDGTIWNTADQTLTTTKSVPTQTGVASGFPDITSVTGLRITIVGRSDRLPVTMLSRDKYARPAAENHAGAAPDRFYHYRLTDTVMIRNRMLGR